MKRTINGRMYDTDTATLLCAGEKEIQAVYRKRTGEYFAVHAGQDGEPIISPVSREWAQWLVEKVAGKEKADDLFASFNPRRPFADYVQYNISIPVALDEKIRRLAYRKCVSLAEMLRRMVEAYPEE